MISRMIITGAAGFIGSHLTDRLLLTGHEVTGLDNFTRGTRSNLQQALNDSRFTLMEADLSDANSCRHAFATAVKGGPVDMVWHMAANSDISAGVADPRLDLRDTFLTTFHVLESMREFEIPLLAFASSSAVYGDHAGALTEETGPLFPVSNYGAMKLASEGAVSAAVESFLEKAWIFRFPNVIGGRATHGVIFDLLNKLLVNSSELEVLGDGTQQKPYLHVGDLIDAMFYIREHADARLNCFNISGDDEGVTVRFIAESVVRKAAPRAAIRYAGGSRGWVGDVPRFRYSTVKLSTLGWRPLLRSEQAVGRAVAEVHADLFPLCNS
jgi:UDP-glucose 4-epimerase